MEHSCDPRLQVELLLFIGSQKVIRLTGASSTEQPAAADNRAPGATAERTAFLLLAYTTTKADSQSNTDRKV